MKELASLICAVLCFAEVHAGERTSTAVSLDDFRLSGNLTNGEANFTLTATARVESPKGGAVELLSGPVALTEVSTHPKWTIQAEQNRFVVVFNRRGIYPIRLRFAAVVRQQDGWNKVDFRVAPSTLQPISLNGLSAETEFEFPGGARLERSGAAFTSYLPSDGRVKLSWKETRPEGEGKLFYAAEMLSQISVSPGLMRQVALLNFKVMQGELSRIALRLRGVGEVTRVQGEHILAWNLEPVPDSTDRRLVVQFNQPQQDQFTLQVQMQTALGAFPQAADAVRLSPEGATRFAGYFRIVNEGAVRLEVSQAAGLSQISPEQFPESDASRAALRLTGSQRFAYRFSGADYALRIQADQVLPELMVSELLAYRLGETELAIDSEIELDIREAPLRELLLGVPKGYAVARLNASGLTDYFVHEPEGQAEVELRLIFGQPVSGRQVIELRLERNKPLAESTWALPRIDVAKAKSFRGHIAVAAEAGFRITPERTQGLTEIATAFFPRKVAGIQSAFRLSDPLWQATMRIERLPQAVQADALHLFSIGEGIAYGSSLINYTVSGAPISTLRVDLSSEYFNVEFTGKDIRNWQKTDGGYIVQLHTPVAGAYTLLATYERPFKAQGEMLTFTGARPVDAQTEQGHTLIISAYQFQVRPVDVSPGLLALETAEVPAEYRLFFDAPILAAYRYVSRPFNLKLALSPLAQGDSLSQVVDRASFSTRISKEGQVLTDVHYFVKSRGNPHFRISLPTGTELWSATVNGTTVVPVADAGANLIPLPQGGDPNSVIRLDLKLAAKATDPTRVRVSAPMVGAPVMLAEWKVQPDTGQRLLYRRGSLAPKGGAPDGSGFAMLARLFRGDRAGQAYVSLATALGLLAAALIAWRWASQNTAFAFRPRFLSGTLLGLIAAGFATVASINLVDLVAREKIDISRELIFLAPVQQTGTGLSVEVANVADKTTFSDVLGYAWPGLLALPVWAYGWMTARPGFRAICRAAGWGSIGWGALRWPNGGTAFLVIAAAFGVFQVVVPALARLWKLYSQAQAEPAPKLASGAGSAATGLIIGGLVCWSACPVARASPGAKAEVPTGSFYSAAGSGVTETLPMAVAQSVIHDIRVEDKYAIATARIHWQAEKGETLPLLFEPGVLTGIICPSNAINLVQTVIPKGGPDGVCATNLVRAQALIAQRRGDFDIELKYELEVAKGESGSGFALPVHYGLVNRLHLTVATADVDIFSPQAVSVQRDESSTNSLATLVLAPAIDPWIGWKPRSRDLKREKPVFYAEVSQLFAPAAGSIEGAHYVSIRPAQGELSELILNVPNGASVTDVIEPARYQGQTEGKAQPGPAPLVSLWRFDPDTRKLRVTLTAPQSHPFVLLIRSQFATGPLPLEQTVGLLSVNGAADQVGLLGIGTGADVQLDSVNGEGLSPINLEDFPGELAPCLQSHIAGLAVRRAFRYADVKGAASLKASAVEPDVRVEMQDTLSLGEDRTVLAAKPAVEITRAGIFRLSFVLPAGFEVESISGSALSHWTEAKGENGRVITLHLNGKTEGKQQFAITLAGAGVKATNSWTVPQVALREASKQRGTLLIVPEQGLRLQVGTSEGVTQLDPQKSGIKQKGVLAFRVLQTPHSLALDVEEVDPWIQVTSLQQASVTEAQIKVAANFQYQIENTGLKNFRLLLPVNAEGVRFQGEQIADFLPTGGSITNGLQVWNIKLHRRVIGPYLLQVTYQIPLLERETAVALRGAVALDVNLQRGFVTVQSGGRLQLGIDAVPNSLQPAEWQSIPRALQHGLPAGAANFSYRLVEPTFELPLKIERHEAAKLLAARVNSISFNSVISDDGVMLTLVRLEMLPGDKRLLNLTLPKEAHFWFAFVNRNGVWPWRDQDRILIPLEQQSRGDKALPVELFYSCHAGTPGSRSLDLDLVAPKFDLPLENLTWRVSLNDRWKIKKWSGSLQLQQEEVLAQATNLDLQNYLQTEAVNQQERTKQAEEFLATGNSALAQGEPQQARRAFQAAYGLSAHDAAFNEDARVQLHNIKLQQALIGLNVRQAASGGDPGALAGKLRDLRNRKDVSYTQQDAKDIIERNNADDNAAYMRLAERLIQQQDAAMSSPTALRASIPDQGRVLTFKRAVVVDPWADLQINLRASALTTAGWSIRALILAGTFALLLVLSWAERRSAQTP